MVESDDELIVNSKVNDLGKRMTNDNEKEEEADDVTDWLTDGQGKTRRNRNRPDQASLAVHGRTDGACGGCSSLELISQNQNSRNFEALNYCLNA